MDKTLDTHFLTMQALIYDKDKKTSKSDYGFTDMKSAMNDIRKILKHIIVHNKPSYIDKMDSPNTQDSTAV